jgi:hypothetical protein
MRKRLGFAVLVLAVVAAASVSGNAKADYGPLAVYQVAISQNCNNPTFCGPNLGGFWGWAVFNSDGTADAQLTGCGHLVGGGGPGTAGAGHFSADVENWYIDPDTGTFWVSNETDTFVGHGPPQTSFTPDPSDAGIPAAPGHYSTDEILGFAAPPGVSFQIQVVKIPNR